MIWALSQQPTRRNCSTGEDAGYLKSLIPVIRDFLREELHENPKADGRSIVKELGKMTP